MVSLIKPNAVFIDVNGAKYKIKTVFPEISSFSYWFKDVGKWRYEYKGVKDIWILDYHIKQKLIVPYGKASLILYGKKET